MEIFIFIFIGIAATGKEKVLKFVLPLLLVGFFFLFLLGLLNRITLALRVLAFRFRLGKVSFMHVCMGVA